MIYLLPFPIQLNLDNSILQKLFRKYAKVTNFPFCFVPDPWALFTCGENSFLRIFQCDSTWQRRGIQLEKTNLQNHPTLRWTHSRIFQDSRIPQTARIKWRLYTYISQCTYTNYKPKRYLLSLDLFFLVFSVATKSKVPWKITHPTTNQSL